MLSHQIILSSLVAFVLPHATANTCPTGSTYFLRAGPADAYARLLTNTTVGPEAYLLDIATFETKTAVRYIPLRVLRSPSSGTVVRNGSAHSADIAVTTTQTVFTFVMEDGVCRLAFVRGQTGKVTSARSAVVDPQGFGFAETHALYLLAGSTPGYTVTPASCYANPELVLFCNATDGKTVQDETDFDNDDNIGLEHSAMHPIKKTQFHLVAGGK